MLYDVALLPQLFDVAFQEGDVRRAVILKTLLRDMAINGTLADLNKEACSREILKRIAALPDLTKGDLIKGLNVLRDRNRVIRRPKRHPSITSDGQWIDIARMESDLHAVILDTTEDVGVDGSQELLELDQALDHDVWASRSNTWTVPMDIEGYKYVLTPLLRFASKLILVDPYITPSDDYKPFISLCAALLGKNRGISTGFIEIHACSQSSKSDLQQFFQLWEPFLHHIKQEHQHEYRVYLYKKPTEGQRFHDRFVLTNQCGVVVPNSMRVIKGNSTEWQLMDYDVANKKRSQFESPRHPHLERVEQGILVV